MHALVLTVTIAEGQSGAAQKALEEQVVPRVRGSAGFVKGYWTVGADKRSGLSLVVFKTEEDAKNAANMARTSPTPPGVTVGTVEVRQVIAEA